MRIGEEPIDQIYLREALLEHLLTGREPRYRSGVYDYYVTCSCMWSTIVAQYKGPGYIDTTKRSDVEEWSDHLLSCARLIARHWKTLQYDEWSDDIATRVVTRQLHDWWKAVEEAKRVLREAGYRKEHLSFVYRFEGGSRAFLSLETGRVTWYERDYIPPPDTLEARFHAARSNTIDIAREFRKAPWKAPHVWMAGLKLAVKDEIEAMTRRADLTAS